MPLYFKSLADQYTISDNFHQSVMGGTGANHIMFGFGDAIYYTNTNGVAAVPPINQIENPNPQPSTNNFYDQDGYGGGSYVNCGDISQPGVPAVTNYHLKFGHGSSTFPKSKIVNIKLFLSLLQLIALSGRCLLFADGQNGLEMRGLLFAGDDGDFDFFEPRFFQPGVQFAFGETSQRSP